MSQRDARLIGGIYRLGQVITTGGMLTTYTAYNRNTNDVVGLLVVEFPPTTDDQFVQQLLQPLERRRSIQSPNVMAVHDWGIDGSRVYIATDPPRGINLRQVLDTENTDLQRSIELLRQMALGLKVLHDQGVVGIDLRPQLITVDTIAVDDRVQIDDVGLRSLLKALGYVPNQRADDIGYLDPRYAPPEWIGGGQTGPWSDMYQLGLLFFEMVTGRPPFVGKNLAETGVLQSTGDVPRMALFKHDTPAPVQDFVACALAKNPSARFASVSAMLNALDSLASQLPRRSVTGQWPPVEGNAPTKPGGVNAPTFGLTNEMAYLEKDVSKESTLVGGQPGSANLAAVPITPVMPVTGNAVSAFQDAYAFLCFEKDGAEITRFALTKKDVVVGRTDPKRGLSPDVDLTSLDPRMTVSRQHGRIRYEETFFYIEDLKSRNKTWLGELELTPLKPELLQHGDIVSFGAVRLIFKVPGMLDRPKFGPTNRQI